jgi:hypothetical protein
LKVYDRGALLEEQDKAGKWAKRVKAYKRDLRDNPDRFGVDQTHQRLIEFLFPELAPLPLDARAPL